MNWLAYPPVLRSTVALLIALLVLITCGLFWRPVIIESVQGKKLLPQLRSEEVNLENALRLNSAIKGISSSLHVIKMKMNHEVSQQEIVRILGSLSSSLGVTVIEQTFRKVSDSGGLRRSHHAVTLSGNYNAIRNILVQMSEKLPGLAVMSSLSLSPDADKITARVELEYYTAETK